MWSVLISAALVDGGRPSDGHDEPPRLTACAREEQVKFLVGITGEQLCAAYSSAELLVFPSLAEGFGWPIAEAMACGCLVLTTGGHL